MPAYKPIAALLAVACAVLAQPAGADDDAAALRAELDSLKSDYDARVAALEARIAALESAPESAAVAVVPPVEAVPAAPAAVSASAFNPAISLVLAGSYADTSRDPGDWRLAGFVPNGGEIGPGERSFSLGESELTLAASVDPYFTGQLTVAITGEDEVPIERNAKARSAAEWKRASGLFSRQRWMMAASGSGRSGLISRTLGGGVCTWWYGMLPSLKGTTPAAISKSATPSE